MLTQITFILLALLAPASISWAAQVTNLHCEYGQNPQGIDAVHPQLSWQIVSDDRNERQAAYQILAASSPELLARGKGDLWDSGKVASGQSIYVAYAGAPLRSRMRCFWKVRVWDKNARPSAWSRPAHWTMGLLAPEDWSARWITPSRWFTPPDVRPPGFITAAGQSHETRAWADIDLGAPVKIDSIKLYPQAPSAFPLRFRIEGADEMQFTHPQILADQTGHDYQLTGTGAQEFSAGGRTARWVRLSITRSPQIPGSPDYRSIVRQMEVISGGRNVARGCFAREFGTSWYEGHAPFLVDGMPSQFEGDTCPADACPTTAAPLLRKSFTLQQPVKRATLYLAALGMADCTINGKKAGDETLGPPFSDYTKRIYYVTHDITPLLVQGENVIGATLGNGYFSPPRLAFGGRNGGNGAPALLAQVEIEFADGTRRIIATDESWKWSRSEITDNDLWDGYAEDRRLAKPGWDQPGYAAADWRAAAVAHPPHGMLTARIGPPVRVLGSLKPVRAEGDHLYFDVLSAGWPRVTVNGKAGRTITLVGRGPGFEMPKLSFTPAADGPTVLEPRFIVLAGPLDLEVQGSDGPLTTDSATMQLVNADFRSAGAFTCSNAFLNTLYQATLRTHMAYNIDVPADPTREKQGWTQDAQNMFETAAYFTDVAGLYRKWWRDMADNQDETGYLGSVVPVVNRQVYDWNSPWWSGVLVFLPWKHYQYYGDRQVLKEAYEPMRRYVDFLGIMADNGLGGAWDDYPYRNVNQDAAAAKERMIIWNGAGDWHNPTTSGQHVVPTPMTTMPAYYYYAAIVSQTAALLGKKADAAKYDAVAQDIKSRFNAKYFHPDTGLYGDETDNETAQVLPLAVGLVPADKRALVRQRLIDAIHARKDHIGTGFVALSFLLQLLTESRKSALANAVVNQKDYPSWATLMHDGMLGEDWHGGGAQMPSTGGAVGMWLFQSVLGIRPDPAGPGFQRFILAPQPDPATGLTSAQGHYDSAYGRIVSDWSCAGGRFTLLATVPVNTTATIYLPARNAASVTESGHPCTSVAGLKFLRMEEDAAVFQAGSGTYRFASDLPGPPH